MQRRFFILTVTFVSCWALLGAASRNPPLARRQPLLSLSMSVAQWQGRSLPPLEASVLAVLGADDHINRLYSDGNRRHVGLYIGYHASQRQGDSIHSPMNCLPGAGWLPVRTERLEIADPRAAVGQQTITMKKVIVQNGENRQLVLYWYQSQGRVVASEYMAKAYLFLDAIRTSRTDAALVRIVTPIAGTAESEWDAQAAAVSFATSLLPLLERHLPS